jgi:hypothetical protein
LGVCCGTKNVEIYDFFEEEELKFQRFGPYSVKTVCSVFREGLELIRANLRSVQRNQYVVIALVSQRLPFFVIVG